jgi:hypothetical protein
MGDPMTCDTARGALATADERVDDDVAVHLDGCPACRSAFDERWTPVAPSVGAPLTAAAVARWLRPYQPRVWPIVAGLGAAAAIALVAWAESGPSPHELAWLDAPFDAGDLGTEPFLAGGGSQTLGDVTLVLFWEASCVHCDGAIDQVEGYWRTLGPRGLDVVGVTALRGTTEADARAFLEVHDVTFPNVVDRNHALYRRFDVDSWPRAAIVECGQVTWVGHPIELDEAALDDVLKARSCP